MNSAHRKFKETVETTENQTKPHKNHSKPDSAYAAIPSHLWFLLLLLWFHLVFSGFVRFSYYSSWAFRTSKIQKNRRNHRKPDETTPEPLKTRLLTRPTKPPVVFTASALVSYVFLWFRQVFLLFVMGILHIENSKNCLLYTSPSPRDS